MKEIWKDIPNYEGIYQVSNLGRVKSLKWNKEKILNDVIDKKGYLAYSLFKNNIRKTAKGHQLVAMAFLNYIPNGKMDLVVDHINNVKTDNRLENLQIVSNRENISKDKKNCTSIYTGVSWHKATNKWRATIKTKYKQTYVGLFECEYEAHLEYQKALDEIKKGG